MLQFTSIKEYPSTIGALINVHAVALVGSHVRVALGTGDFIHSPILRQTFEFCKPKSWATGSWVVLIYIAADSSSSGCADARRLRT